MDQGNLSRRGFLQRSLAALSVGTGLPVWFARELFAAEEEKRAAQKPVSANSKIIMGAIGIGSPRGRCAKLVHQAKEQPGVEVVAACDVDARHLERAAKEIIGGNCAKFKDFRDLLARKDINAVIICTPDHWHALMAVAAMKAGKDVYCEKPLTLTIDEGKALVKVAKATGRILQVGSQQRAEFDGRFRLACELVRNGRLGKIKMIETRIDGNPTSPSLPKVEPPKELDWDFWLGPAPWADYVEKTEGNFTYSRCHYEFRWWYEYSGGKMTDWGAHHNDIAQWALDMDNSGPVAIEAVGKEPSKEPNSYNCHPAFTITYTYANGVKLICTSSGQNGIKFVGEDGKWLFVNRRVIEASDKKIIEEPLPKNAIRLYAARSQMGNFVDCVRTRKKPITDVEIGHRSVTVCHLGVIALRSGKKLQWDPAKEQFVGDAEANKWLRREMRAPWKLEV